MNTQQDDLYVIKAGGTLKGTLEEGKFCPQSFMMTLTLPKEWLPHFETSNGGLNHYGLNLYVECIAGAIVNCAKGCHLLTDEVIAMLASRAKELEGKFTGNMQRSVIIEPNDSYSVKSEN